MERGRLAREAMDLARAAADGSAVLDEALRLLDRAVGADVLSSSVALSAGEESRMRVTVVHAPALTDAEDERWRRLLPTHPFARTVMAAGPATSRLTDHMAVTELEALEVYQELLDARGNRYQLAAGLSADPSCVTLLSLWRRDEDFTDEEVAAVETVRGALTAALAYRAAVDELARMAGVVPRGDLTPRQREICGLLARGLTNGQIARRTGVTERTVRKHVEDVFARTGCTNRTAVAVWWRGAAPVGVVADPPLAGGAARATP